MSLWHCCWICGRFIFIAAVNKSFSMVHVSDTMAIFCGISNAANFAFLHSARMESFTVFRMLGCLRWEDVQKICLT